MRMTRLSGLLSLLFGGMTVAAEPAAGSAKKAVDLPEWNQPAGEREAVRVGDRKADVWGGQAEPRRFYSAEMLPGVFERTLVIDRLEPAASRVEWIFTGERGGLTVVLEPNKVTLQERYYDSFALHDLADPKFKAARHPEKRWTVAAVEYQGALRAVTLRLEDAMLVGLELNGEPVAQAECRLDLSQHQVRLVAPEGAGGGMLEGAILRLEPVAVTVAIDPGSLHQEMLGFGGITPPTAYAELSPAGKRRWWEMVREYNLLLHREYPIGNRLNKAMDNWDRIEDATPHYYGDNFPNGEISDFDYIRINRQLGGKSMFEFWQLPAWARQDWTDKDGKVHKGAADPAKYAEAMLAYCRASASKSGAPPDIVGVQNEVWQPAPIWHDMTLVLRRELDNAGFADVQIHMTDAGSVGGGIRRLEAMRQSPEAWDALDYTATHFYDYQRYFLEPDKFDRAIEAWNALAGGKPFLSTEICVNDPRYQISSYRLALLMAQLYHKNLSMMDASAICYCWLLLNVTQPSYGATRSLCVPDHANGSVPVASSYQLRTFGAYSRRIQEGMRRVDATCDDVDLMATAFTGDGGGTTVVLLNRGAAPRVVSFAGMNLPKDCAVELCGPYQPNVVRAEALGDLPSLRVDPGAIVTISNVPLGRLPTEFKLPES